jgi:hypothetical protein
MIKFVKWYLCGACGREVYPTVVLFSGYWFQLSGYVNSKNNWFHMLFRKVDIKVVVCCAMNATRIIWPIGLWDHKFLPVYHSLFDNISWTPGRIWVTVCLFQQDTSTAHTNNKPVHSLQSAFVNRIINRRSFPFCLPDLVLWDKFLVLG